MESYLEHGHSHNGTNGANQTKSHPATTFSLFMPEFNLTTNKVKHNAVKAKDLAKSFVEYHQETKKPFIRIVSPICMDRCRADDCYSIPNYTDILYKLASQFRGHTLCIDIVPTGELDGWNILLSQRLKQRKQSLESFDIRYNSHESPAYRDARDQGRAKANAWAMQLAPVIADLRKKGHIIEIKHWPDAFPNNEKAQQTREHLAQLYGTQKEYTSMIDDAILTIIDRLKKQGLSLSVEAAQPCILNYLLEELSFQVYLATETSQVYDFHLYEKDDLAPKLTQQTLYYARANKSDTCQTMPALLEFKLNKATVPISQNRHAFLSDPATQPANTDKDIYREAERILYKQQAEGQELTRAEVVIVNVYWRILEKQKQAEKQSKNTDVQPMDDGQTSSESPPNDFYSN